MQLPLAYYGNPVLRKKTIPVVAITEEIRQLVQNMIDTMHALNGIGLAAPQVHQSLSLFITQVPIKISVDPEDHHWKQGPLRIFINPKIITHSKETTIQEEACLSIPGVSGKVERPYTITVHAMDLKGNIFEEEFSALQARAIMHENDHINGTLYIDRVFGKERRELDKPLNAIKKKYQ
jgi:peptide deformylase